MSGARQATEEISIATVGKICGEPKIQFESGEAMEKCEKSVCLPATALEQRLETQHWLTRAWPGHHSVQRGPWSLVPGDPPDNLSQQLVHTHNSHNIWCVAGATEAICYWTEKLGPVSSIPIVAPSLLWVKLATKVVPLYLNILVCSNHP